MAECLSATSLTRCLLCLTRPAQPIWQNLGWTLTPVQVNPHHCRGIHCDLLACTHLTPVCPFTGTRPLIMTHHISRWDFRHSGSCSPKASPQSLTSNHSACIIIQQCNESWIFSSAALLELYWRKSSEQEGSHPPAQQKRLPSHFCPPKFCQSLEKLRNPKLLMFDHLYYARTSCCCPGGHRWE